MKKTTKAVILAGGMGTRLRPYSFTIPKPLIPIDEEPILLHLIKQFKKSGITQFYIALGYHAELIKAYFGDGSKFGIEIEYILEEKPLGTAGPLSLMIEKFEAGESFFLANGDIHTELDFKEMIQHAADHPADVTVGCIEKRERSSYGVLQISDQKITEIIEKPETRYSISSGIYLIHQQALERIPNNEFFTMPDLINSYLEDGLDVGSFMIKDFWIGIENVKNLESAVERLQTRGKFNEPSRSL